MNRVAFKPHIEISANPQLPPEQKNCNIYPLNILFSLPAVFMKILEILKARDNFIGRKGFWHTKY